MFVLEVSGANRNVGYTELQENQHGSALPSDGRLLLFPQQSHPQCHQQHAGTHAGGAKSLCELKSRGVLLGDSGKLMLLQCL